MRPLKKMWTYCRIVSSARAILAERGIRGLTMRAIAADANITATAIYRHFEKKQALIEEVIKGGYREMDNSMMRGHKAETPEKGLQLMFDAALLYAQQHPRLFELMMRPGSPDDGPWKRIAYHMKQWMRVYHGPAQTRGRLLWMQMRGALSHGHRLGPKELGTLYRESVQTVLKAAG